MEKKNKESKNKKMSENDKYIRFDCAAKRMLRDKANFGVFEGLMTVLIGESMKIVEVLESEDDMKSVDSLLNRIYLKAINSQNENILVEVKQLREYYYLYFLKATERHVITNSIIKLNSFQNIN